MTIRGVLDRLVSHDDPPGLVEAVAGLDHAQVWEGPWDVLASPGRLSVRTPAALVSLVDVAVVDVGRTLEGLRSLAPAGAGVSVPPARRTPEARARPTCLLEVAVTLLLKGGKVDERAGETVDLAEQVIAVLVEHAVEHIAGENLNSDKLREKGLSAFALSGYREIEIEPAAGPARELPSRVDVRRRLSVDTVYPVPEC